MEEIDFKEQLILDHYKDILQDRTFDEYDILGFLITVWHHLKKDSCIHELADLIAHRVRVCNICRIKYTQSSPE